MTPSERFLAKLGLKDPSPEPELAKEPERNQRRSFLKKTAFILKQI